MKKKKKKGGGGKSISLQLQLHFTSPHFFTSQRPDPRPAVGDGPILSSPIQSNQVLQVVPSQTQPCRWHSLCHTTHPNPNPNPSCHSASSFDYVRTLQTSPPNETERRNLPSAVRGRRRSSTVYSM